MAIYVDELRHHGPTKRFRWRTSCHLMADSLQQLHAFALRLGLKRQWFQDRRWPHYDLTLRKRRRAIALGALEVHSLEWMRKRRVKE